MKASVLSNSFFSLNCRHEFHQKRSLGLSFVLVLAIGLSAVLSSRASVIVYDNLGSAPYDVDGYSTFGLYSDGDTYQRGIQFTPSQTVTLSTLQVAIGEAFFTSGNSAQSGTASVQLMTDHNNAPGVTLESWTSANISGSPGNASVQSFTSVLTPTLTAGSNYWIVLGDASGSSLGGAWCFADDSHTGDTLTMWANLTTGSTNFTELTRGFRSQVAGNALVPSLSIMPTATNTIVLSWPLFAAGWVLQRTNSLANATNAWPQVPTPYSSTSTNYFVVLTNPPAGGNQFFRLQAP